MFRHHSRSRRARTVPLSLQSLESRLPMAGDMALPFKLDASAVPELAKDAPQASEERMVMKVITPLIKSVAADPAVAAVARLAGVQERAEVAAAMKEAEQAGVGRDIAKESQLTDPATGEPISFGRERASAFDPAMGGRGNGDPLASGKARTATDPITGKPLVGGSGGEAGSAGPSRGDAMAAGRAGKGRAMSDGDDDVVTDDTSVKGSFTFGEALIVFLGESSPVTVTESDGSRWTFASELGQIDGENVGFVWVTHERPGEDPVTALYVEGEKGPTILDKPRPDDDGGTPPRQFTEAEKQAIMQALRGSFGPAGRPRDDHDPVPRTGATGDVLTDLELAGQPRPDDGMGGGGATPGGPVLTDLGLAGQPVGDDPGFGVLNPRFGGPVAPARGFDTNFEEHGVPDREH